MISDAQAPDAALARTLAHLVPTDRGSARASP